MKILIAADWHGEIYAEAIFKGFESLGHKTSKFSWKEYFYHYQYSDIYKTETNKIKSLYYKAQNKFILGPAIWKINRDLLKKCSEVKPDLVFVYRGTHIFPKTIAAIKEKNNCKVFGYNNDDPFSIGYPKYFWRYFKKSIPFYDHIFAYRPKNIDDYKSLNYNNISILKSYYLKDKNFHINELPTDKYKCDVIFIGHFEDDGRDEAIALLIKNDINIKLYGTDWEKSKKYKMFFNYFGGDVEPLYGDNYNLALNSAKIALVFLSKLNNDAYTRRCFEIPATKTMMMAEYTDELSKMFKEGEEAEYFRDKIELLKKVKYYLANEGELKKVGGNGYLRLVKDGHEVVDRCREVIRVYEQC